jgi:aminomethyltransferase
MVSGKQIGSVTSAVWSPRLETNVSLGQLAIDYVNFGTQVLVQTPNGDFGATVCKVPFL